MLPNPEPQISVRLAVEDQLPWINARYDEVGFRHSQFPSETIAVALIDEEPCGLGRLVRITPRVAELGGIYVFPDFRGKGIAREIVGFLLSKSGAFQTVYCLPFAHLTSFYCGFGFTPSSPEDPALPPDIIEKLNWCNCTYGHETILLKLWRGDA
ncbi:MAG: GNAT family N-acetyltransferase [Bdellovibrionales bacterium]|nr:GNAT family N-acetyltransferase [Bdellovibrionales bacterium]